MNSANCHGLFNLRTMFPSVPTPNANTLPSSQVMYLQQNTVPVMNVYCEGIGYSGTPQESVTISIDVNDEYCNYGCTNQAADNYDPEATCDCTDPSTQNNCEGCIFNHHQMYHQMYHQVYHLV